MTRGLDVQPLLERSNLTTAQIKKPEIRIAVRAQIAFLTEVASAIQDDFLGVHLAQSLDLRELGLLYYVLASSETLGEALKRLARYSGIHNEGVHIICQDRNALGIDFQYFGVSRVNDFHQIEFFDHAYHGSHKKRPRPSADDDFRRGTRSRNDKCIACDRNEITVSKIGETQNAKHESDAKRRKRVQTANAKGVN